MGYIDAIKEYGQNQTGVFGMRMMWESMGYCMSSLDRLYPDQDTDHERLSAAFATSSFIHLERKDKVAQAVSRLRAEQTGLWHIHSDGSERERLSAPNEPVYSKELIDTYIDESEQHHAKWRNWFQEQRVSPFELSYEDLSENPVQAVTNILTFLKLDTSVAESLQPRTAKLGNNQSEKWIARYRQMINSEHNGH